MDFKLRLNMFRGLIEASQKLRFKEEQRKNVEQKKFSPEAIEVFQKEMNTHYLLSDESIVNVDVQNKIILIPSEITDTQAYYETIEIFNSLGVLQGINYPYDKNRELDDGWKYKRKDNE